MSYREQVCTFCLENINIPTKLTVHTPIEAWIGPEGARKLRLPDLQITLACKKTFFSAVKTKICGVY
jgi:hypothetical protein